MYKPNTTVYLCNGTGLDMANSIWWHRFAYPTGESLEQRTWWNTCFQWVKAHSISHGFWYLTMVSDSKGYFDVGQIPRNDGSIPVYDSNLGSDDKTKEMNDPNYSFLETIRAVDYCCFVNDGQNTEFKPDVQYAFVTRIVDVNQSTARVFFTIDGLMTYQKYFHLGRSFIARDMQFQERKDSATGKPNYENLNREPEPFMPQDTDYVFREITDLNVRNPHMEYLKHLGQYKSCFVITDVDLDPSKIKPNSYYGGLPAFEASDYTHELGTNIGIGVYYIPYRKNNSFNLLGSYNAMEHILYTYLVPEGLLDPNKLSYNEPTFVSETGDWVTPKYSTIADTFYIPNTFDDSKQISDSSSGYLPLNLKLYNAPYRYYSFTDKQGGSFEIDCQSLDDSPGDEQHFFNPFVMFKPSIAPNFASALIIANSLQTRGTPIDPYLTMWQMPSYSMTPNNSGYNSLMVNAIYQRALSSKLMIIGGTMTVSANMLDWIGSQAGMVAGAAMAGPIGGALGSTKALSAIQGANIGMNASSSLVSGLLAPFKQIGGGITGGGVTAYNAAMNNAANARAKEVYGLPKAIGGLPQGYTFLTMQDPGYLFYVVQLRTYYIKQLDLLFSFQGYNQYCVRYPHINIRKRWCYVQVPEPNLIPQQANTYPSGGIPFEIRKQITDRLSSGVTFWNVRHAIMGDGDSGGSDANNYDDPRITACIHCKFVKNYGKGYDSAELKDNISYTGGYANDYSDEV